MENSKSSNEISPVMRFWLSFLGFNFRRVGDGRIIRKGDLLDLAARNPDSGDLYEPIRFEPQNGWKSPGEENAHFQQVAEMKRALNV